MQVMIDIMFFSSFYCHFVIVKGGTSYAFKVQVMMFLMLSCEGNKLLV